MHPSDYVSRGPGWQLAVSVANDGLGYAAYYSQCMEVNIMAVPKHEYREIQQSLYDFQIHFYGKSSVVFD